MPSIDSTCKPRRRSLRARPVQRALLLLATVLVGGCAQLTETAWSNMRQGSQQFGLSSGWAFYQANVEAKGTSGVLQPGDNKETGNDDTDLDPQYGFAAKYSYLLTDSFSLGGIVEYRSFDPDSVSPLDAKLSSDDFQTWHLTLSSRYFFPPFKKLPRIRSFVGLDLSYVPSVEFSDVEVTYSQSSGIPPETLDDVSGSSFWTLSPVIGGQYLLTDHLTLDFGCFYEFPLTSSQESVTFDNLGGAKADVNVEPEGLIVFGGISLYF